MVCCRLLAVSYQPCKPSSNFRSTSVYVSTSRTMDMSSTSAYASSASNGHSFNAISASNFETLNSEGGACYRGSGVRKGRPGEDEFGGSGGIGDYTNHSPIGDTPWILFALMAFGYVLWKKWRNRKAKSEME